MAVAVRRVADDVCGGRLLLALEGGYDLEALADCVDAVLEVVSGPPLEPRWPEPSSAGRKLSALFREHHGRHWRSLAGSGSPPRP
jgi:acetoin utilization deacetylase AcuC-like enzyme